MTPLLYDFSYEALAEGLGLLDSGRFTRPNGKVHLLLESDTVWSDLRARPFEEVPDKLKEHSDAFVLENESVLKAQRGEAMSLARRQEASRAQFSFGFVKRRDALRIQQELVSALTKRLLDGSGERTKLFEQLNIEQDLATGRTADGYDVHPRDVVPRVRKALAEMVAAGKEAEREEAARAAAAAAKAAEEDAQAERGDHVGEDNGGGGPLGQRGVARSEIGGDCGAMERCRLLTLFSTCRQPDDAVLMSSPRRASSPPRRTPPCSAAPRTSGCPSIRCPALRRPMSERPTCPWVVTSRACARCCRPPSTAT